MSIRYLSNLVLVIAAGILVVARQALGVATATSLTFAVAIGLTAELQENVAEQAKRSEPEAPRPPGSCAASLLRRRRDGSDARRGLGPAVGGKGGQDRRSSAAWARDRDTAADTLDAINETDAPGSMMGVRTADAVVADFKFQESVTDIGADVHNSSRSRA